MRTYKEWSQQAKCRGYYGDLSKKYCADCPVLSDCYAYAVVHQEAGFWGGTYDTERTPEALSCDIINAMRSMFRDLNLLEERTYLSASVELREAQQLEHNDPTVLMDYGQGSNPSQSLEDSA
jgi:hypothetical protein